MKLKKKLLSALLAGAMTLSLMPGALAAWEPEPTYSNDSVTIKVTKLDSSLGFGQAAPSEGYLGYGYDDPETGAFVNGYFDLRTMSIYSATSDLIRLYDYHENMGAYPGVDPITGNTVYGFINRKGDIVINPKYERVDQFSEGLCAVVADGKVGYIDTQGNMVIQPAYDTWAMDNGMAAFQDGLAFVTMPGSAPAQGWFINSKGEKAVSLPQFDMEYVVGDWGSYANPPSQQGKVQCYYPVEPFVDGCALVAQGDYVEVASGETCAPLSADKSSLNAQYTFHSYAILDKSGNVTPLESFVEELLSTGTSDLGIPGTTTGELWASFYPAERIPVQQNGSYALANLQGELLTPYRFDMIYPFDNGVASASLSKEVNGKTEYYNCVIDTDGNYVLQPIQEFDFISDFDEGYALATQYNGESLLYYCLQVADDTSTNVEQPSSWAAEQVNAAISAGIVPASLQSKYTQTATRAEFCALAVAMYETVTGSEITDRLTFADTSDPNVEKMAALGVVNGTGGNNFSPNDPLNREQAATILARLSNALGKPIAASAPTFNDNSSISSWAFDSVGQVQAAKIMEGTGGNNFSPAVGYSREQCIITMMRLYDQVK